MNNEKYNKKVNINNVALSDKNFDELSLTYSDLNLNQESQYKNSNLNFFGVSSGLTYTNLDTTIFNKF